MNLEETWKQRLARPASCLELGGRPPESAFSTWFGKITVILPTDAWPESDGRPMWPLLQIMVRDLPVVPESIKDLAAIQVFIDPEFYDKDTDKGKGFCVRAFQSLEGLVPTTEPPHGSEIKPFPGRWTRIDVDYPTWDDVARDIPAELGDRYYDIFDNNHGTKVGGWPSTVQSEIQWAPWNKHPINPEYVFQIDTTDKADWAWGDSGFGYFGRGTGEHTDKWAMAWQCY